MAAPDRGHPGLCHRRRTPLVTGKDQVRNLPAPRCLSGHLLGNRGYPRHRPHVPGPFRLGLEALYRHRQYHRWRVHLDVPTGSQPGPAQGLRACAGCLGIGVWHHLAHPRLPRRGLGRWHPGCPGDPLWATLDGDLDGPRDGAELPMDGSGVWPVWRHNPGRPGIPAEVGWVNKSHTAS